MSIEQEKYNEIVEKPVTVSLTTTLLQQCYDMCNGVTISNGTCSGKCSVYCYQILMNFEVSFRLVAV
jgi:hypothetical protein